MNPRKIIRDFRLGWQMALHHNQVDPLGKCTCGHCDYWLIKFQGRVIAMPETRYQRTLRMVNALKART